MTLYRAALSPAARAKAEANDKRNHLRIIKTSQTARAAVTALHDCIGSDPHSKGLAAALAHLAETVTTVIEARHMPPVPVAASKGKRAR